MSRVKNLSSSSEINNSYSLLEQSTMPSLKQIDDMIDPAQHVGAIGNGGAANGGKTGKEIAPSSGKEQKDTTRLDDDSKIMISSARKTSDKRKVSKSPAIVKSEQQQQQQQPKKKKKRSILEALDGRYGGDESDDNNNVESDSSVKENTTKKKKNKKKDTTATKSTKVKKEKGSSKSDSSSADIRNFYFSSSQTTPKLEEQQNNFLDTKMAAKSAATSDGVGAGMKEEEVTPTKQRRQTGKFVALNEDCKPIHLHIPFVGQNQKKNTAVTIGAHCVTSKYDLGSPIFLRKKYSSGRGTKTQIANFLPGFGRYIH